MLFAIRYALDRQVVRGPIKKARSTPALLLRIHPKGTEFAQLARPITANDHRRLLLALDRIFVRAPCVLRGLGSALDFSSQLTIVVASAVVGSIIEATSSTRSVWKAAAPCVLANQFRVRRDANAGDLVFGDDAAQSTEAPRKRVSPYHFAYVATGLGEAERAIDWLERAVAHRTGPAYGLRGSFLLASLHGHPRFEALVARLQQSARTTGSPAVE